MKSSDPAGSFGNWITDEAGLPAYEYTCDQDKDGRAAAFTTCGPSRLHWHQIGNDRLTAIVSNRGETQVFESSRGHQWLNRHDPALGCPGGGIAIVGPVGESWCDLYSPEKLRSGQRRIFGTFYFRKIAERGDLALDHRIIAPAGDEPALVAELHISNISKRDIEAEVMEYFGVNIVFLGLELVVTPRGRRHFGPSLAENAAISAIGKLREMTRMDTESLRERFAKCFKYKENYNSENLCLTQTPEYSGASRPPREARASKNYYPEILFLAALNFEPEIVIAATDRLPIVFPGMKSAGAKPCLCLGAKIRLKVGENRRLLFCYGYAAPDRIGGIIKGMRGHAGGDGGLLIGEGEGWKNRLAFFDARGARGAGWLERETVWHSSYARGAALYDEYYENHFLPQGGVYDFLHGARGAVRDFSFFAIPLVYLDPRLAREHIEFCLRMMTQAGRIMYASYNFGQAGGAIVHNHPSDLQLFLMWAIAEYVFFTRDFGFLEKRVPFYPRGCGASTVRERVELSLKYLFGKIGMGEHGLLRVGDGDWSDGISLFVKDRRAFVRRGESAFTSAMALYVLPKVAELLEIVKPGAAAGIVEKTDALLDTILETWNGKWFYRGYDGRGRPIGDRRIFLEHHAWLLISRRLPPEMISSVINNIHSILDKPSPFGQMLLYPPARTFLNIYEKGWDVNGGVWYAMNFLLTWAYAAAGRPDLAWESLRKNSLLRRAEVYPDIWYGLWSGPDAYNAHHAQRSGETFFHIPTPSTDFPVMNLNLHANFLLALIKLCGIEPGADGLHVSPAIPLPDYELKTPSITLRVGGKKVEVASCFQSELYEHKLD